MDAAVLRIAPPSDVAIRFHPASVVAERRGFDPDCGGKLPLARDGAGFERD